MSYLKKHRFLILRRFVQLSLMVLYILGAYSTIKLLEGNLSSSLIVGTIPLSDPYAILQIYASGSVVGFTALLGGVIVLLLYGLFLGRAFCSWVCPMNMVTDLANFLRRVLKLDRDESRFNLSRKVRYWILGLSIPLSLAFALPAFEFVSPISMLHRGVIFGMGLGWAAVLAVFLFDLFVQKNGFCGHICPLGAFYSIIGRFSLLGVRHDSDKCTLCMKCKAICPEKEVLHMVGKESAYVSMGECINCGRCIEVCDDDALNFSIRGLLNETHSQKADAKFNVNKGDTNASV